MPSQTPTKHANSWVIALVSFLIASGVNFGFFFELASMGSSQTEALTWSIGTGVGFFLLINGLLQAVSRMPD
jgi:hypothetical protein